MEFLSQVDRGMDAVAETVTMRPDSTPAQRLIIFGGLALVVTYAVKPRFAFTDKGQPKPFGGGDDQTYTPWWLLPAVAGGIGFLF